MGGTFKSFGVIYIGLVELYQAGEFTTSLVSVINTVIGCIGCKYINITAPPFVDSDVVPVQHIENDHRECNFLETSSMTIGGVVSNLNKTAN